jgi:hypothetical protein
LLCSVAVEGSASSALYDSTVNSTSTGSSVSLMKRTNSPAVRASIDKH